MKLLVVYNPYAGHKKAAKLLENVRCYFLEKSIEADIRLTEHKWHGIDIVAQSDLSLYDGIIAAGGDGTLFEVINGLFRNKNEQKPALGVIPNGTGNAFARDLDLRTFEWQKAIDLIAKAKTRPVDVAHFVTEKTDYYYLNILGLGFVADVNAASRPLKMFGNFAYTLGVIQQLLFLKPYKLELELDGDKIERYNIFVEISNTRWTGSTFLMAPDAKIDDGFLDVILLNAVNRRRLLKLFPTIFNGTHINFSEVENIKARSIKIKTAEPKVLTPDGELMGSSPLTVNCLKHAIRVFCP